MGAWWRPLAAALVVALGGVLANGHVVTLLLNPSTIASGEESAKSGSDEYLREHHRHRWRAGAMNPSDLLGAQHADWIVDSTTDSIPVSRLLRIRPPCGFRQPLRC
jgi:hypothetical protein